MLFCKQKTAYEMRISDWSSDVCSSDLGVNLTVFPTINAPDYKAYAQAIIDGGVKIVETAGTQAVREIWEMLKPHGVTILHKCTAVRHALSAEKAGCDIISIDGFECAGHPGEDDIPGLILIPAAADKVKIPMLASGGFGDGRGLVAALSLGAEGINMGTRFCAPQEAPTHANVKQAYFDNADRGRFLIFPSLQKPARAGQRAFSDKVKIPMLASGGFGDGRGLVAALSLGAEGINMGTRFCATQEAPIHANVKQAYVDNDERGSFLIFRSLKNTARVGKSAVSEEVVRRLSVPGATFADVAELVNGKAGRELLETGDLSKGVFWAGMVQGLIHDIPTCQQLIERIIHDAQTIIHQRLAGFRR